jgi:hypothetical protein
MMLKELKGGEKNLRRAPGAAVTVAAAVPGIGVWCLQV